MIMLDTRRFVVETDKGRTKAVRTDFEEILFDKPLITLITAFNDFDYS